VRLIVDCQLDIMGLANMTWEGTSAHGGVYGNVTVWVRVQGSNTTLRNHITHPHCEVIKEQKNQNPEAGQTSMARDESVFKYDLDYLREQFAGLVIQRALPFNHFDQEQTTRIELDTWQMMKRIISFEEFPSPHTGHALFKMLIKVLANFNLEDKVMSITLDNAINNTSAMDKLKLKYDPPMGVGLYNLYYAKYDNPTQSSQANGGATSSKAGGENNYSRLLNGLKTHTKKARTDPTISSEFERYVNSDFVTHLHPKEFATFDVLGFWKEKERMFPVLSLMAMDLISVQASSVASESAFSTSERVLSIRRTRLTPASLEMCMCVKDHLDAIERKQDKCPLKIPLDFEEDVFDDEVQRNEAIPLSDEEIALDSSSEGTLSPGGPQYDYMMSSEGEDDY
nr:zinc finger BED domain-containing protein RICESLEEPER 2 [Tanacetum cinerariifolium]